MVPNLPDYTIVRELGSGATATVYLAVQNRLNRRVALKVLASALSVDAGFTQRFLREGRIVAKLSHPNIVPVFDVGEHEGVLYMAMEFVGGGSLAQRSGMTVKEAIGCLRSICLALEHAHGQGFVHRDIKPDNVLFREDGVAMLADFGVARATESLTRMTVTGSIIGTPAYMSPEQVGGGALDGRADLYSLGILFYELLTGHRPFSGDSVMSVGLQHITAPVPALPAFCSVFNGVLSRLLAKKAEDRYPSASALRAALDALAEDAAVPMSKALVELHVDELPATVGLADALAGVRHSGPRAGRTRVVAGALLATAVIFIAGWWAMGVGPGGASNDDALGVASGSQAVTGQGESPNESGAASVDVLTSEALSATASLLEQAEAAIEAEQWFPPAENNAVNVLRQVLAIDPQNRGALTSLEQLRRDGEGRFSRDVAAGRFAQAQTVLAGLQEAWPDDAALTEFASILEQAQRTALEAAEAAAAQRALAAQLASADAALTAGRLIEPAGDNAAFYYQQAQAIDPDSSLADAGLRSVTEQLLGRAERAIAELDFDTADEWLVAARNLRPAYPRILTVDDSLQSARDQAAAEFARQEAAAALQVQIGGLRTRIDAWLAGDRVADGALYQSLMSEAVAMRDDYPDETDVQLLILQLEQNPPLEPEAEATRFDLPAF